MARRFDSVRRFVPARRLLRWGRWGRWGTVRPTRRALVAFLAGLPLAALPAVAELGRGPGPVAWPWLAFVALAAALLAVDASKTPTRDHLSWRLAVPRVLPVGRSTEGVVELTVAGAEPGRGWIGRLPAVEPPPLRAVLDVSALLESPAEVRGPLTRGHDGAGRARLVFPLTPRRRGRVRLERLWLALPGPLGLVERVHRIDGDDLGDVRLEARSDLAAVERAAVRFADRRSFLAGLKIERFAGDGTEFEALREFQPGFDLRSIDWKASARHRDLLCREMRAERNHQVVLALDTGRLMGEPLTRSGDPSEGQPIPRLDHAIHAALLLSYIALKSGDRVGLFAFDQEPRLWVPPRSGPGAFPLLHAKTAGIDYGDTETNFTRCLTTLATRLRRRSLVIVLTELVDSITAELMVENLSHLARRHLVVLAALRDPGLARRSRAVPQSLLDVQRALVADSLLAEREVVLRRLDRQGLATLDVAPQELEPRLLDRYLEIKRREMVA